MSCEGTYRGRIAPSPTGLLHLGHARTFWTAYRRARDVEGTLVLRMEDLDPQRSRREFADAAIEDLQWLGIRWQEGPDVGGPCGPYAQSERQHLYEATFRVLRERGQVYPCRCSRKELALEAQAPHEGQGEDNEPVYPGTCRPESPHELADLPGETSVANWRFRVPDGEAIEFSDGHFRAQCFVAGKDFGDFLVWRRDGVPSYQLAVVVDDAAMNMTEVVRGADLLKSTARQILLYRALDLPEPLWYHCELVAGPDGGRLSKREDAMSLRALRAVGIKVEELLAIHKQ